MKKLLVLAGRSVIPVVIFIVMDYLLGGHDVFDAWHIKFDVMFFGINFLILWFLGRLPSRSHGQKEEKDVDDDGHCKNTEHCGGCLDDKELVAMPCLDTQHCSRCWEHGSRGF